MSPAFQSPGPRIADRMADYFRRHIEWTEEGAAQLDRFEQDGSEDGFQAFQEHDAQRARALESLEAEFTALLKEWKASSEPTPAEREQVRALAQDAQAASDAMKERLERLSETFGAQTSEIQTELGTLRRVRNTARKFAAPEDAGGGFVDRRA